MIDTNVVIDILEADGAWLDWSLDQLVEARREGPAAVSVIVVGELATRSMSHDELRSVLIEFGVTISDLGSRAAYRAGVAQRAYREAGGARERLLGDFLIGAHAETEGGTLLTRDPRRYRQYFPDLSLITPETDHG